MLGLVDPEELLATIEEKIGCIKEEAFSRREIMEKVEKWMGACEEESWLEDYNKVSRKRYRVGVIKPNFQEFLKVRMLLNN